MTAALTQVTERFRYLVAFRPGLMSPTLAAHMAATFQRISGGRLLLNIVTGGDDVEQQRFGDHLQQGGALRALRGVPARRPRAVERRTRRLQRRLLRHPRRADHPGPVWPEIYFGGSSAAALDVAARYADVYLTWGEPPAAVAEKLDRVRERAKGTGRELRFGIRLHVIAATPRPRPGPRPSSCSTG